MRFDPQLSATAQSELPIPRWVSYYIFVLLARLNLLVSINFCREFDQQDALVKYDFSSRFLEAASINLLHPWLIYSMMNLLQLTLMVLAPPSSSSIPDSQKMVVHALPAWLPGEIYATTRQCSASQTEKNRLIYRTSAELDAKLAASGQVYHPTHIACEYLVVGDRGYQEALWLETCYVYSRYIVLGAQHLSIAHRALLCMEVLLRVGDTMALMPQTWTALLQELVSRLPLTIASPSSDSSSSSHISAEEERICLQACNLIFNLIIKRGKDFRSFSDNFQTIWLKFLSSLAANINASSRTSAFFTGEILEMVSALLRLLQPPSKSTPVKPQSQSDPIALQTSIRQVIDQQQQQQSSNYRLEGKKEEKVPGYSFLGNILGWNAKPSRPNSTTATAAAVTSSTPTDLETEDVIATATVTATATPITVLHQEVEVELVLSSSKQHDFDIPTIASSASGSDQQQQQVAGLSSEDDKLLSITWSTLNHVCASLPSHLKSHNPQLIADITRSLLDDDKPRPPAAEASSLPAASSSSSRELPITPTKPLQAISPNPTPSLQKFKTPTSEPSSSSSTLTATSNQRPMYRSSTRKESLANAKIQVV
jgi:hypothetical protein